jgi:glycosyltransferase involved in cell wall biosynthesis
MRILLLYDTLDTVGGIEQRNRDLAAALVRRGHDVTLGGLASGSGGGSAGPDERGVRRLVLGRFDRLYDSAGRRRAADAWRFARHCARLDLSAFDVVETASLPFAHLAPLARAARRARVPLAVTWYEFWDDYWRGYVGAWKAPAFRWIERRATRYGRPLAASCDLTRRRLRPLRPDCALVPCGVDLDAVRAAGDASAPDSRPVGPLVFAGRMLAEKRIGLLLAAIAHLARGRTQPGELLTLFGDGPARARFESEAAALGVADRVSFRGRVPALADVWSAMARSAIAVQPSEREGFGLFPLEAMALGLPVVHCRSSESAVGEVVRDGIDGFASDANAEALAATLARLLDDPALRDRCSAAARARAAEYGWDRIAGRFLDWLGLPPSP